MKAHATRENGLCVASVGMRRWRAGGKGDDELLDVFALSLNFSGSIFFNLLVLLKFELCFFFFAGTLIGDSESVVSFARLRIEFDCL